MGFFFENTPQQQLRNNKYGVSKDTLHMAECKVCPLNTEALQNGKMQPSGTKKPLIYVLGEAPGLEEDRRGEPFVGKAGSLLRKYLIKALQTYAGCEAETKKEQDQLIKDMVRMNNTIRCHPPRNRNPEWIEMECCRPFAERDIEAVKPSVILGMGAVPLNWVSNETKILSWHGNAFPVRIGHHECWYMPCLHPSYVQRKEPKHGVSQEEKMFERGINKAIELATRIELGEKDAAKVRDIKEAEKTIISLWGKSRGKDIQKFHATMDELEANGVVAFDIETHSDDNKVIERALRPYGEGARILSIAISDGRKTLSVGLDHPDCQWNADELNQVWKRLDHHFETQCIDVAHNLNYEMEWLGVLRHYTFMHESPWDDSMAQAYVLGVGPGMLSLNSLCMRNFGLKLKSYSDINVKRLIKEPIEKVLRYNGLDSYYTYHLYQAQKALIEEAGFEEVQKEQVARIPTLIYTQMVGLPVDQAEVVVLEQDLVRQLDDIYTQIRNCDEVKEYEAVNRSFNPGSPAHVVVLLRDIMRRTEGYRGEVQSYGTDKEVLEKINKPVTLLIQQYREVAKLLSTYVETSAKGGKFLWSDDKLHTSYKCAFVKTRRLSSEAPNLQNEPKRKYAYLRNRIAAPEGKWIMACDYGQMEARVCAMVSKDPVLVRYLYNEFDIHQEFAEKLAHMYPKVLQYMEKISTKKDPMKLLRQETKNKFVFACFYGAGYMSIARHFNLPEDIIRELYSEFWDTFKGVKKWQEQVRKQYLEQGYVELLTGFRCYEPFTATNGPINYPIQGTSSDIVVGAMTALSKKSYREGIPELQPILNVHDDLTFLIPDSSLETSMDTIVSTMLNSPYTFINVPLKVEVKVGRAWGSLEKIGEYSSNLWKN